MKSRNKDDYLANLKRVFDTMRAPAEDEPNQVLPGESSGKFLGFVVTSKGIHLDPEKICAIQEMQPPKNIKEFRGLHGQLAYI